MTQQDYRLVLIEALANLNDAAKWLRHSYTVCTSIGTKNSYTIPECDAFEALTSRFARTTDLIAHKVLRAIDRVEFEYQSGTLLDVMNRAHKKGLIESVDEMRNIKELRNTIAHEYASAQLQAIFQSALEATPKLFTLIQNIQEYCRQIHIASP
jgi:hypothetical protein